MSLFKKIFGRETAAELEAQADAALAEGQFGTAKLIYERAIERAQDPSEVERLGARVKAMRDLIARSRIAEANRYFDNDSFEEAVAELRGAAEVASDPAIVREADAALERIRGAVTMSGVGAPKQLSRTELVDAATSGWSEDEAIEFESLGEPMLDAVVAMESGRFEAARDAFEALLAASEAPRWLHREVARARWAAGDAVAAHDEFVKFFEAVSGDEHDRALFVTRLDHARLLSELGRVEDALAEIEASIEHAGDSPRAFVAAAAFLREHGHAEDAHGVLEAALDLPGAAADRLVQIELAMIESALGRRSEALLRLERVALDDRQRGFEPPRDLEGTRATLMAELGRKEHAAELFRRLALATTDPLAFEHAREAARLHAELGHVDEAARLLDRAERIAPSDEARETIAALRGALTTPSASG